MASGDSRPYVQTTYEASPLNRPIAEHGASEAWAEHPVSYRYVTRNPQSFPNFSSWVSYGDLLGVCTTDEDGNQAYDFKDGLGRTILAGHIDGSEPYFTHYEYDSRDDLVVFTHLPFLTPNRENLKEFLIGKAVILTAMTSCTATFTRNFRNVMLSITSMTVEAIRSSRKTANSVPAENGAFPFR